LFWGVIEAAHVQFFLHEIFTELRSVQSHHKDVFGMAVNALKTSELHLFRADGIDIALECAAMLRKRSSDRTAERA
jgi:hypothetical protein